MNQSIIIRPECNDDIGHIEVVTIDAFKHNPHSSQTEHKMVAQLRNEDALAVSLVAELHEVVVGHIAFSEVKINDEFIGWYGLAPVSVKPQYQNKGVGSHLVLSGLDAIQELSAKGCVLLGEPGYYKRFGFKALDELVLKGVPPEYFQALLFSGDMPSGTVEYHKAFA